MKRKRLVKHYKAILKNKRWAKKELEGEIDPLWYSRLEGEIALIQGFIQKLKRPKDEKKNND